MAISPGAVVRYFSGDSSALSEYFFDGSGDELNLNDSESDVDAEAPLDAAESENEVGTPMDVDEGT